MSAPAQALGAPAKPSGLRAFFGLDLLDNRYPALHGLRVVAIVSVVQYHVTWIFWGEQGIPLERGFVDRSLSIFFGMDLFFLLSGFLIGSILLRSLQKNGTQDLRRFYLRRVLRTFPSYYVVLTILALALPLTATQRAHLPYEYTYLTNFVSLHRPDIIMFWGWSLSLEEQFYLTVPLLFFVLHRLRSERARFWLLGALFLAALVVRLVIYFRYRPWNDFILYGALYFRTHTRFDTLVAGILLAFIHQRHGEAVGRFLARPFHRALLAIPALTCLWLLLNPAMFGEEHVQFVHVFAWGTVTSLMYLCALPLLLHGDGWIHRGLSAPFFRRAATLGYGVYLVHIPIIDHVVLPAAKALHAKRVSLLLVWPASLVATMLISFVIGYAMHVLIEKPSLRLRERFAG
ncbi:MAG TPA: acyltransferase [Polyangium sp.]|nr:acyltransferase [Polyangium sp.]